MRAVLQRVKQASVSVDGERVGSINKGILILLCVEEGDTAQDMDYMERKIPTLRIFPDEEQHMNLSVTDVEGEILLISQFTLAGDARRGTRPSYSDAARPETAQGMYDEMAVRLSRYVPVKKGVFGADMQVSLVNDGPVTLLLDSRKRF